MTNFDVYSLLLMTIFDRGVVGNAIIVSDVTEKKDCSAPIFIALLDAGLSTWN